MELLIERLMDLEKRPDALTAAIHACWVRHRREDGWRLGRADHLRRSSPYLKPLAEFKSHELEREIRLALNDLRGVVRAIERSPDLWPALRLSADCRPGDTLRELRTNRAFVATACAIIHDGWRDANRMFATYRHDVRLSLPFAMLAEASQQVTVDNVHADIEAMAQLLDAQAQVRACNALPAAQRPPVIPEAEPRPASRGEAIRDLKQVGVRT